MGRIGPTDLDKRSAVGGGVLGYRVVAVIIVNSAVRALVVNCSRDWTKGNTFAVHYNLGAKKLADWWRAKGYQVTELVPPLSAANHDLTDYSILVGGYDLVAVCAVFSWHVRLAATIANNAKAAGAEVWAGGTGFTKLSSWFNHETGIQPSYRPDARFEYARKQYKYVYAVRGCEGELLEDGSHRPCAFCNVPAVEGTKYILDPDFVPAPNLLDNNLAGMPVEMQEHIIKRYTETDTRLIDAKSGFEPGHFDEATFERWKPVLKGPWRWGFDRIDEEQNVRKMARLLKDVGPRRKMVYCLCGNEPVETCYERAQKCLELGAEPWVQFMIPMTALDRYDAETWAEKDRPSNGWTVQLGRDFARYYSTRGWRSYPIWKYRPRDNEPRPFAFLEKAA